MDIYLVGGAVRDELLGREVLERDWVVVGSDDAEMLAHGFRQKDAQFPVYLHPQTGDEYALARTETKSESGHRGFVLNSHPGVTLEADLARRDLTINAMAKSQQGKIIAPHGGESDLHARILRHITEAFVEDPLRALRLARFRSQLAAHNFDIAKDTEELARIIAHNGELPTLSGPRVWSETCKALEGSHPDRYFLDLQRWNAMPQVLPELLGDNGQVCERILTLLPTLSASDDDDTSSLRFAMLFSSAREQRVLTFDELRQQCERTARRLGLSKRQRTLLLCATVALPTSDDDEEALLQWFESLDGLRQPTRITATLRIRQSLAVIGIQQCKRWVAALHAAQRARPAPGVTLNKESVRSARLQAIARALSDES